MMNHFIFTEFNVVLILTVSLQSHATESGYQQSVSYLNSNISIPTVQHNKINSLVDPLKHQTISSTRVLDASHDTQFSPIIKRSVKHSSILVCQAKVERLVRYPNTVAPEMGWTPVRVRCADNANFRLGYSLNVRCNSDGSWSTSVVPVCDCIDGYREHGGVCIAVRLVCQGKRVGLVRYPTHLAPVSGSVSVDTECADNSHRSTLSSQVSCNSNGAWSGEIPQCACNDGYRKRISTGGNTCEAIPSCPHQVVGLVHYPTSQPTSQATDVTVTCAANAHIRDGSSQSVKCNYDGTWSGSIPLCGCDNGYKNKIIDGKSICQAIPYCPSTSFGLLRYPTTLAPINDNSIKTVIAMCADNAHNTSTLEVGCNSVGSWMINSAHCKCNDGYLSVHENGRTICKVTVCDDRFVGLVHYPTTFGNHLALLTCIDHADRIGPEIHVMCDADGQWSTELRPYCQCSEGYREAVREGRYFCEAIPRCPAKTDGLVQYPTTYSGSTAVLECANNAHSNSSNMTTPCDLVGTWSQYNQPYCVCNDGYRQVVRKGQLLCEAIPSCPAKAEGLVRYPTTLAPISGELIVKVPCADNAHRTSSSLNVTCNSDGTWSGKIPLCECDSEYYTSDLFNDKQICLATSPLLCEAQNEGLVHYPNWLAPILGSELVEVECADNAHLVSLSLNVTCGSDGEWSGVIPLCECDKGHHLITTSDGKDICKGERFTLEVVIALSTLFILLLTFIFITITLIACLLCKRCRYLIRSKTTSLTCNLSRTPRSEQTWPKELNPIHKYVSEDPRGDEVEKKVERDDSFVDEKDSFDDASENEAVACINVQRLQAHKFPFDESEIVECASEYELPAAKVAASATNHRTVTTKEEGKSIAGHSYDVIK